MGCTKTVSIVKAMPVVFFVPAAQFILNVPVTVNTNTGVNPAAGPCPVCPSPATVTGGLMTVTLCGPGGPFMGTAPLAPAGAGFQTQVVGVPVTIPAGTLGAFLVKGKATVNFSADSAGGPQTVCAVGDTQVCFVEETSPGSGIPRLDLQLLTPALQACPPGLQYDYRYRVTNNDPVNSVTVMVTATSKQNARMPTTPGDPNRVRSISNPVSGDDFPIEFVENLPGGVINLPPNPATYTQPPINKMITIPPLGSQVVSIATRSYPACADGSCAESLLTLQGSFSNGDPAEACVGASLNVDASAPHSLVIISEEFSGAAGQTPPAGWSTQLLTGNNPAVDGWRWDNPNGVVINPPMIAPTAICDTDFSGPANPVNARLVSIPFDASLALAVILDWDQWHRPLASTVSVYVNDGVTDNLVYTNNAGTPDPDHQSLDITAACGGSANCTIVFEYIGDFDWWWLVDNVKVVEPPAVDVGITGVTQPADAGTGCANLGMSEAICVEVTNFGSVSLPMGTMIGLEYNIDGGPAVSGTHTLFNALPAGASVVCCFATPADLSAPGPHTIDARTTGVNGSPDGNMANDELLGHVVQSTPSINTFPHTEDFETVPQGINVPMDWVNDPTDATGTNSDWFADAGGTSSTNTGPPTDHTTGLSTGIYMYVEDSVPGDYNAVNLLSPCLDLSAKTGTTVSFWVHSNNANGPGGSGENFLHLDVLAFPGGASLDVIPAIGHQGNTAGPAGDGWVLHQADLSAFDGTPFIRVRWRVNSNNGTFTHDIAIDDVTFFCATPSNGQPPQPGLAVMDINNALNGGGFPVSSGANGPYFAQGMVGGTIDFSFSGEVGTNMPFLLLTAPIVQPGMNFPPQGQIDIDLNSVVVVGNGFAGGLLNSLFVLRPDGTQALTFRIPANLAATVFGFQAVMFVSGANVVAIANAVELTVL